MYIPLVWKQKLDRKPIMIKVHLNRLISHYESATDAQNVNEAEPVKIVWLARPSRLRPGRLEEKGQSSGDRD